MTISRWRAPLAFALLLALYQSAEGVGALWLHNSAVQATLMVGCVLAAWPLSCWLGYQGYGAYALRAGPRWLGWLVGGLVLALLGKLLAVAVGQRLGVYSHASASLAGTGQAVWALPMLLLGTFVPSLAEDILTRGFWYRAAGIRWRRGLAFVAFSATLYVLNHIYRLERGPVEWLMLFCFGIAYATALWRSGTLWAAVGLHWGWNLANGLLDVGIAMPRMSSLLSAVAHLVFALLILGLSSGRANSRALGREEVALRGR